MIRKAITSILGIGVLTIGGLYDSSEIASTYAAAGAPRLQVSAESGRVQSSDTNLFPRKPATPSLRVNTSPYSAYPKSGKITGAWLNATNTDAKYHLRIENDLGVRTNTYGSTNMTAGTRRVLQTTYPVAPGTNKLTLYMIDSEGVQKTLSRRALVFTNSP